MSLLRKGSNLKQTIDPAEIKRLQTELLLQVCSRVAGVAVLALDNLRREGWLDLLSGENLGAVKWTQANLEMFDLSFTDIGSTPLNSAYLRNANLAHANLYNANLQGAYMVNANLEDAYLERTNLSGANLRDANLANTELSSALLDRQTILPSGIHWTPDTDIAQFTDPEQPVFWRSNKTESPAYRSKA